VKLLLSNFQIHKDAAVEIPEGETTYLEGDSDTGKSSKLRAIRWACENKPDGGSFVTLKTPRGTTSVVTLEIDGHVITRERGKSKNVYVLDGEKFEAFGRTVPESIAKVLNLSPYAFQLQGESPFLIGMTPTEAAKILSDACGLGVIDTAVGFVRAKKTAAEADIRKSEILMESAQRRFDSAAEALPLADALDTAANLSDTVLELENRAAELSDAIDDAPEGEAIDVEAVRSCAILARSAEKAVYDLTNTIGRLRASINDEPKGVMFDTRAVRAQFEIASAISGALVSLAARADSLRLAISDAPVGQLFYIDPVRPFVSLARVCGEWIADMTKVATQMREALSQAPVGEPVDIAPVWQAYAVAQAAEWDATELRGMRDKLRAAILEAPTGVELDTTELLKQRAHIKVCPTCGREM